MKGGRVEKWAINPGDWQDQFDFSQAIGVRGAERVIYCAGQVSVDANGVSLHPGDMAAQFHQALDNLEIVLQKAGLTLADVVRLNYYVTDITAFHAAVSGVGERLKAAGCKPASTLLGVVRLAEPEWMIEIEATATG
jgi:enamine deaminase RidA (YjgF/YER057c/UK114 family)